MKKFFKKLLICVILLSYAGFTVYADDQSLEDDISFEELSVETSSVAINEPQINAKHAVVFDRQSKKAIFGKKEHERCKMASTTKIMTAIVVIENSSLNDIVKVSKKSARYRWISFRFIHK